MSALPIGHEWSARGPPSPPLCPMDSVWPRSCMSWYATPRGVELALWGRVGGGTGRDQVAPAPTGARADPNILTSLTNTKQLMYPHPTEAMDSHSRHAGMSGMRKILRRW